MPVLVGKHIRLRPPRESDVEERRALGRSPEIVRGYGVVLAEREELTDEDVANTFRAMTRDPYSWAIELDGRLIGLIGIERVDSHDNRAPIRIGFLDDRELNKGYGTEAVRLVAHYAFEVIGLHRLSLRVLASNARAIRCYEKCGFQHEGRERESARVSDGWEDDLIMGLLPGDLIS